MARDRSLQAARTRRPLSAAAASNMSTAAPSSPPSRSTAIDTSSPGGYANDASDGWKQYVEAGGEPFVTSALTGAGDQDVYGDADGTVLSGGGGEFVYSGGLGYDPLISSGGFQDVLYGGRAEYATCTRAPRNMCMEAPTTSCPAAWNTSNPAALIARWRSRTADSKPSPRAARHTTARFHQAACRLTMASLNGRTSRVAAPWNTSSQAASTARG